MLAPALIRLWRGRSRRLHMAGIALLAGLLAGGCASMSPSLSALSSSFSLSALSYYAQSINGHLGVLQAARPIDTWLADPETPEPLKVRLRQVREIRQYASRELGLPDNGSYRTYAHLGRPFVVWNVIATPELSLKMKQWCFPVAGCVDYRGYYDKGAADAYAATLRSQGLDVHVGGVRAYSTLGWTSDPLLSTFIHFPEGEVARLIFHELSHQLLYVPGDSTFNESFATAFEQEGVRRWLAARGDAALLRDYRLYAARKDAWLGLLRRHREALERSYAPLEAQDGALTALQPDAASGLASELASELASGLASTAPSAARLQALRTKKERFSALKAEYAALKQDPASGLFEFNGYDRYFDQELNNSHLAAVATYSRMVPAFAKLLQENDGDLEKFVVAAREIAALPGPQRRARMMQLGDDSR